MSIAIINYGIGNLTSIANMIERIGGEVVLSNDAEVIAQSDKLILPGVGNYGSCMKAFENSGLRPVVEQKVLKERKPVLGICVGAQMMTKMSEESSENGLGWIDGKTIKFKSDTDQSLKIPHMGWSEIEIKKESKLFEDLPQPPRFYFAHSYHFKLNREEDIIATSQYILEYPSAFNTDNIFGVQFHPEKSHQFGMKLLENFLKL